MHFESHSLLIHCVSSVLNLESEDGLSLQGVMMPIMNSLENKPFFLPQIGPLSLRRGVGVKMQLSNVDQIDDYSIM